MANTQFVGQTFTHTLYSETQTWLDKEKKAGKTKNKIELHIKARAISHRLINAAPSWLRFKASFTFNHGLARQNHLTCQGTGHMLYKTKQCWTNIDQKCCHHWNEVCFSSQETQRSLSGKRKTHLIAGDQMLRLQGRDLKGEEKLTTYLNRLWKQFHLCLLAGYQVTRWRTYH